MVTVVQPGTSHQRMPWTALRCGLVMVAAGLVAYVVYLGVGLKIAADCGSGFGLFGSQNDAQVEACIFSHRGWTVLPSEVIVGTALALCVWSRFRGRWRTFGLKLLYIVMGVSIVGFILGVTGGSNCKSVCDTSADHRQHTIAVISGVIASLTIGACIWLQARRRRSAIS
jgi:hypothetical protein